jgi:hypothetical protein
MRAPRRFPGRLPALAAALAALAAAAPAAARQPAAVRTEPPSANPGETAPGPAGRPGTALRVAVLPLNARGAAPGSWPGLRAPILRALAGAGFEVVDGDAVETAMRERRLRDAALLERFEAAGLAAALGADRLLIGAIDLCREKPAPAVSLAGRLVDPRGLRIVALAYTVVDDRALLRPLGIGGPVTAARIVDEAARRFAAQLAGGGEDRERLLRASILAPNPAGLSPGRLAATAVRRLIVLPFRNRTARPGAGQAAADAAAWILWRGAGVDLVDAGDATRRLLRLGWRTGLPVGRAEVLALGRETGVDAVLMGEVDRWEEPPGAGAAPEVAFSVRLLEASTGAILWAAQHERRGDQTRVVYEAGNVRLAEALVARALHETLQPLFEVLAARPSEGGTGR